MFHASHPEHARSQVRVVTLPVNEKLKSENNDPFTASSPVALLNSRGGG